MTTLVYDSTFEGLLTAIFEKYEFKFLDVEIVKDSRFQKPLFGEVNYIITNEDKAQRVLKKTETFIGKDGVKRLLYAFLSEANDAEKYILNAIDYALVEKSNIMDNYANLDVMQISKLTKSVGREKHRMEAFVRFKLLKDGIYFAEIQPDFDVLLLIVNHFKNRYQDQKWIIYDTRRYYGVFYDTKSLDIVHFKEYLSNLSEKGNNIFDEIELKYQHLWKEYFDHANIKERKNIKLHLQHVPKRYWKYLVEKNH
jgi:probable DNA metabolism protein